MLTVTGCDPFLIVFTLCLIANANCVSGCGPPETVSIGYNTQNEDNQEWTTPRDTVSIDYKTQSEENQEWITPRDTVSIGYTILIFFTLCLIANANCVSGRGPFLK
jgi:hypothetical protein